MIPSDMTQMKIAEWRDKARRGELTQDECRDAISWLREARGNSAPPSAPRAPKAASKPAIISGDDLLKDFGI